MTGQIQGSPVRRSEYQLRIGKDAADWAYSARFTITGRRGERERTRLGAYRAEQQRLAEHEARRPVCADCGEKFTDDRWEVAASYREPRPRWRPALCGRCEDRVLDAERRAERERQELAEAQDAQKAAAGSRASAPDPGKAPARRRADGEFAFAVEAARATVEVDVNAGASAPF